MRRYAVAKFLPNTSQRYERGGASLAHVFAQNIDAVSRAFTLSGAMWRPWMYPDLIISDGYYTVFQSSNRTLGAVIGAAEYVAQHGNLGSGIQMYANHNSGVLWQQAGVQIYDTTSWAVECFITTGTDVATLQAIWVSGNSGNTSYVQCEVSGGKILVISPAGTVTGPTVQPNTSYHLIVNMAGTAMGIYLNDIGMTGTGTVPVAQPIGTAPIICIGTTNPAPSVPFLGQIGFVTFARTVYSQTIVDNHYNAYAYASFYEQILTTTIAAGGSFATMLGRGGSYPFPEDILITTVGNQIITVQMEQ